METIQIIFMFEQFLQAAPYFYSHKLSKYDTLDMLSIDVEVREDLLVTLCMDFCNMGSSEKNTFVRCVPILNTV